MILLQADHLKVSLEKRNILSDVSLQIHPGEMVGLIGANGSGKTTLIKSLLNLIPTDDGAIQLLGKKLSAWSPSELARKAAYLPQAATIHWPLSVYRTVALGRLPHLMPWQDLQANDHQAIQRTLEMVDVTHLANRSITSLAGGEKALVLLARLLAVEASLFLIDEPTAGLDPYHQIQAMEILQNKGRHESGLLVVLHDLTLAARFCDRLLLLHDGKILSSGKPSDVLTQENLRQSYRVEAKSNWEENSLFVIPWKRLD